MTPGDTGDGLEARIAELRRELQDLDDDARTEDDGAAALRMQDELEELIDELTRRRGRASATSSPVGDGDDDEDLTSDEDDPRTFRREGWGEDIGPAVTEDEWTDAREDQLDEAADIDDPVEALEEAALGSATEAGPGDAIELEDAAAPTPPEEAALIERAGIAEDDDALTVGLPPGTEVGDLSDEELIEAELAAADADPELAAELAEELERRGYGRR